MRTLFYLMIAISVITLSCNNSTKTEEVKTSEPKEVTNINAKLLYVIDTNSSFVHWTIKKMKTMHDGTISISAGELTTDSLGTITGGEVVVNMRSIKNIDIKDAKKKSDMENYLSDSMFFNTSQFPTAKFLLTNTTPKPNDSTATHIVTGNLTLKDKTKGVELPATISILNGVIHIHSSFSIDRTKWDIVNPHRTFKEKLKDKSVSEMIDFDFDITANRK